MEPLPKAGDAKPPDAPFHKHLLDEFMKSDADLSSSALPGGLPIPPPQLHGVHPVSEIGTKEMMDETHLLLLAALDNQNRRTYEGMVPFLKQAQNNLVYLCLLADQQPSTSDLMEHSKAINRMKTDDFGRIEPHKFPERVAAASSELDLKTVVGEKSDMDSAFWSHDELKALRAGMESYGTDDFEMLAAVVKTKTPEQVIWYVQRSMLRMDLNARFGALND